LNHLITNTTIQLGLPVSEGKDYDGIKLVGFNVTKKFREF